MIWSSKAFWSNSVSKPLTFDGDPLIAAWIFFAALPLVVAPWFLDYAQEAKSLALMVTVTGILGLFGTGRLSLPGPTRRVPVALVLLTILSLVAVVRAPGTESALLTLRNEGLAILGALLMATLVDKKQVPAALHAGAAVIAILGLLQVGFDFRALTPSSDPGQFPGVTFGNRGLASLFVALGVLPGLWLMRQPRHRALVAAGIFCELLFVGIAMTRAVWIGLALAFVLSQWLARRQRRAAEALLPAKTRPVPSTRAFGAKLFATAVVVLGVGLGAWMVSRNDALMMLLGHRLDPANWLQNPRIALWSAAWTAFAAGGPKVWFLGFGAGAFQVLSPSWLGQTELGARAFLDAHNDPLQVLLEFGVLGLALRLGLVALAVRQLARAALEPTGEEAWWPRLCLASAVLLFTGGLFFYPLHLPYFLSLFVFFLGAVPWRIRRHETPAPARPAVAARLAACGLAVVFAALTWKRGVLEEGLRRYVKDRGSFLTKTQERSRLEGAMQREPVPDLYLRLVEARRLKF